MLTVVSPDFYNESVGASVITCHIAKKAQLFVFVYNLNIQVELCLTLYDCVYLDLQPHPESGLYVFTYKESALVSWCIPIL